MVPSAEGADCVPVEDYAYSYVEAEYYVGDGEVDDVADWANECR